MKTEKEERTLRRRLVGTFLKEARETARLTQGEVAKSLSYSSPQFISNWERGVSLPPMDILPRLAVMFEVKPRKLIDRLGSYQGELLKLQKRQLVNIFRQADQRRRGRGRA